jgi:hypothetical protein
MKKFTLAKDTVAIFVVFVLQGLQISGRQREAQLLESQSQLTQRQGIVVV